MSHDTWIHRVARVCVRPLHGGPVTPNHLTAARGVTGVSGAAMLAISSPTTLALGTGLFLLSMLLDRADGELARATGQSSDRGHRFDLWTDAMCDCAALLALGIGQRHGLFAEWAPLMGLSSALCAALIFHRVLDTDRKLGPQSVVLPAFAGFDPDDAIIIIPLAMLGGLGDPVLLAAAFVTPLAAVFVLRHLRTLLHRARPAAGEEEF